METPCSHECKHVKGMSKNIQIVAAHILEDPIRGPIITISALVTWPGAKMGVPVRFVEGSNGL